jgi:hypothetical protein
MAGYGLRTYFDSGWNILDCFIVVVSAAGIFGSVGGGAGVFRVLRLLRVLKLMKYSEGMMHLLQTVLLSLPAFLNIGALLLLVFFCYAVLGVQLFAKVKPYQPQSLTRVGRHRLIIVPAGEMVFTTQYLPVIMGETQFFGLYALSWRGYIGEDSNSERCSVSKVRVLTPRTRSEEKEKMQLGRTRQGPAGQSVRRFFRTGATAVSPSSSERFGGFLGTRRGRSLPSETQCWLRFGPRLGGP